MRMQNWLELLHLLKFVLEQNQRSKVDGLVWNVNIGQV